MTVINPVPMAEGYVELIDREPFFAEATALELEYQRASEYRATLAAELTELVAIKEQAILAGDGNAYAQSVQHLEELSALVRMAALAEAKAHVRFAEANKAAAVEYRTACNEKAHSVGKAAGYPEGSAVAVKAEIDYENARSLVSAAGSRLRVAWEQLDAATAALR